MIALLKTPTLPGQAIGHGFSHGYDILGQCPQGVSTLFSLVGFSHRPCGALAAVMAEVCVGKAR